MAKFTGNGLNARIQRLPETIVDPVPVTQLTATNPATLTVAAQHIGKFKVGDVIVLANPPGTAATATGNQTITAINYSTRVITIGALNGSGWTGGPFNNPAGMTAKPVRAVVQVPVTGMTNAKWAVLTVASTDSPLFVEGNLVRVFSTGAPVVDNKAFRIGEVTSTTVELIGADTRANLAVVSSGLLERIAPEDMLIFCLTNFERAQEAADAIDVSTFCGAESIAGVAAPGTISIEGYIDFDEPAQDEWRRATDDGLQRVFSIDLQNNNGQILYVATASGSTETFAVNEPSSLEGEAVLAYPPAYLTGANNPLD